MKPMGSQELQFICLKEEQNSGQKKCMEDLYTGRIERDGGHQYTLQTLSG